MLPQLVPLILFGIAAGFSPGPNNIMTSYTAFNFGIKKTIPTMLGVIIGWPGEKEVAIPNKTKGTSCDNI